MNEGLLTLFFLLYFHSLHFSSSMWSVLLLFSLSHSSSRVVNEWKRGYSLFSFSYSSAFTPFSSLHFSSSSMWSVFPFFFLLPHSSSKVVSEWFKRCLLFSHSLLLSLPFSHNTSLRLLCDQYFLFFFFFFLIPPPGCKWMMKGMFTLFFLLLCFHFYCHSFSSCSKRSLLSLFYHSSSCVFSIQPLLWYMYALSSISSSSSSSCPTNWHLPSLNFT